MIYNTPVNFIKGIALFYLICFLHVTPAFSLSYIPIDSLATRYSQNNKYIPDAFPRKLISVNFSMPVKELMVIYPAEVEKQALVWRQSLSKRLGKEIPFLASDKVSQSDLANHHLMVLGNINSNLLMMDLYKQRYAFADAYFPGPKGFIINPSPSIWNKDRHVLTVGVSRKEDLDAAFNALLEKITPGTSSISIIRILKTELSFGSPPETIQPVLTNVMENPHSKMAPYATIANWGLSYHLSGDKLWAKYFRDGMYMLHERARKNGSWITEPWTNVYFSFSSLILAWDLIDNDPEFTAKDRKIIEEVLWGYTKFISWLPNLDPDQSPPNEMRQNHTTFLALSLYFSHRYFTEKYDLEEELAPLMVKVRRAFDEGQGHTFIPNDDAGGYIQYAPLHTLTYLLSKGDTTYIKNGTLARTTELITATFDNRGDEVSFGDVGGYRHSGPGNVRGRELSFFGLSAQFYKQPRYQALYKWLSSGKKFNLGNLYNGEYATEMASGSLSDFTGIQAIELDAPARAWFGRRTWNNKILPLAGDRYFHKIAFRQNFDPMDEYLLLDGMSGLSHGHQDGNSILRLTWKDRIWLFDLDYIKFNSKYHNGVTITRNGIQEDVPPLSRLDFKAEGPQLGISQSTVSNYSGADWERTILWSKGSWFFILDRVRANEAGEYRLVNRWRTRGEVKLEGSRTKVIQGGKSFYIKSADSAPRQLNFEPDKNWDTYEWGKGGLEVLTARQEMKLGFGEDFVFANLLSASDDTSDPGHNLSKISESVYTITKDGQPSLIGLESSWLKQFGFLTDADLFIIDQGSISLMNVSGIKVKGISIEDLPEHLILDVKAGTLKNFKGETIRKLDLPVVNSLKNILKQAFDLSDQSGKEVLPDKSASHLENFGLEPFKAVNLDAAVTARADEGNTSLVLGDAKGRILIFEGSSLRKRIITPAGAEITALAAGDINGDGSREIIAGDRMDNLYCYNEAGDLIWQHKLTAFSDRRDPYARDIHIAEIDDSGKPVILVGSGGWKLYAFEPSGAVRWESFVFYHPITRIGVLNAGKGKRYVIAGTEYHTPFNVIDPKTGIAIYYSWEEMGSEFLSSTEYYGIHLTDMTFFDANGDGSKDLIFGTISNHIYAANASDGAKIWEANIGGEVTALTQFAEPSAEALRLLVANDAGDLSLFDKKGQLLQRVKLGSHITSLRVLPLDHGRIDIAATTRKGDLIILDGSLQVRAAHHFGQALTGTHLTGKTGRVTQLLVTGLDFVQPVDYEAFHLRRSSSY